jgi:hypothetical protein
MHLFLSPTLSGARQLSKPTGACFSLLHAKHAMVATMSTASSPIIELREYELHPEHSVAYVQTTAKASELRKALVPLRFFSLPDTGGQLNIATHAYHYAGGHAERDAKRGEMGKSTEWKSYLTECRPYMKSQCSSIFVEAPLVNTVEGVTGLVDVGKGAGDDCILELRRYKLILGYDTVPKFLSLYGSGLASKLSAQGTDPTTSLATVMYSEVGRLNEVIEIWRHGDGTEAMERSRVAARAAPEWRSAIAEIAGLAVDFTSTIHRPTSFSPIQ